MLGCLLGWFCKQIEKEFLNRRGAENTEEGKRLDSMQKRVKVKPNSKQQSIKEEADDSFTVHLKSPPVDGKANEELIKVQKGLSCLNQKIRIKSGLLSRQKLIEIDTK